MNPLTNAKNLMKISEKEIETGMAGTKASWHNMYKDSAWIFVGGLDYDLTEGDIITVFSQYGEIVNINLVRDRSTGKSKGFAFICYEDQRSTILAVDNLNTIKLVGKTIRVDHVEQYKVPKQRDDMDEETLRLRDEGCAPKPIILNPTKVKTEQIKVPEDEGKKEKDKKKASDKKSKEEKKHKRDRKHKRRDSPPSSVSSRSRSRSLSKSRYSSHRHRSKRDRSRSRHRRK